MVQEPAAAYAIGALALLGAYKVAKGAMVMLGGVKRHMLRGHPDFSKYNKGDSWAVVTGGSDGIGLEICHQMAAAGYNICIISRTTSKIETKLREISAKFPKLKTRGVTFDFSKHTTIKEYKELIGDKLKNIDIGMLFLNAGFIEVGPFASLTPEDIESSVTINALQPIYTTKVLIDQMIARNHLGAMVVTSSGLGSKPVAGCLDYSCTKSFASFLAEGLNYELKGKVDCMAWQSGKVATKMNGDEADGSHCVTTQVAVTGMLRHLGKESLTYGCVPHSKSMFMINYLMPWGMIQKMFWKEFCKVHKEQTLKKKQQ